jgi:hypothetical protein
MTARAFTGAVVVDGQTFHPTVTVDVAPAGGPVLPGTVGYLGPTSALNHYAPPGSGLPGAGAAPPGCVWGPAGLRCDNTDLTLDHVYIHGGIYWTGTGTAGVTNSILENPSGQNWYVFYSQNPTESGQLHFTDCTARHLAPNTATDVAPIWANNGKPLLATRLDISGMPQGLPCPGGSVIDSVWIHDLAQPRPGNPLHMDGIFSQGGDNWAIRNSRVDVPLRNPSDVTAAIFVQVIPPGSGDVGGVVENCWLRGGSYTLRNETMTGLKVRNTVFAGATFGDAWNQAPGTIGEWAGNTHLDGSLVAKP